MDSLLTFNPAASTIMLMDVNSCFATIEQQANPLLRGKPVAVAAFTTPGGCILAASVEAKKLGIKTGMRVRDGQKIYKNLIVLPPDPWKYRNVHLGLRKIISGYTDDFSPKSIDEFVLNLKNYPVLRSKNIRDVALEIKRKIRDEIGEWITVSIGIAPNRYLAKIAAGLHKPDGLDEINKDNFLDIYSGLKLTDLTGIKTRSAVRLNSVGIYNVLDFYHAPLWKIKAAFHSITSKYWYTRLRGYEVDDVEFGRRSYGNSVAIGVSISGKSEIAPILSNLVEKMSARMRAAGYTARGVHLSLIYKDGSSWHQGRSSQKRLFDSRDIFRESLKLLYKSPFSGNVHNIAVSVFDLENSSDLQLNFFENVERKKLLMRAVDSVNESFGDFVIRPARMLMGKQKVLDRIAFGGVKELAEFTFQD